MHAEWQHLEAGELVRTNRERTPGKSIGWPVVDVDHGRSIVLQSRKLPMGTYDFLLVPRDDQATRLLVRDRAIWQWWEWPFAILVFEPLHAYMETGMLQGIKQRAERLRS